MQDIRRRLIDRFADRLYYANAAARQMRKTPDTEKIGRLVGAIARLRMRGGRNK